MTVHVKLVAKSGQRSGGPGGEQSDAETRESHFECHIHDHVLRGMFNSARAPIHPDSLTVHVRRLHWTYHSRLL